LTFPKISRLASRDDEECVAGDVAVRRRSSPD
jgi:hypothetical protein